MKDKLVKGARKALPKSAVNKLEEGYRKTRVRAASAYYGNPATGLHVIAVTGTNGKTTTINYLNEIFKAAGKTTAMFSTANIEINGVKQLNKLNRTVALTGQLMKFLRQAKKARVDYVFLEVTSHALHQHKLDTIPVECAVMTNLTQDHLDYHGTMENYAAAKAKLFETLPPFIVLNRDDPWYTYFERYDASESKMTYGTEESADTRISHAKLYKKGSEVELVFDTQTHVKLATALPGRYNVYNLAAAASVAYLYHLPIEAIMEGAANLDAIPGRYERPVEDKPYDIIVDYAHTPDALEKLLETVRDNTKNRVILVFGACGDRDKTKRPVMGKIAARLADRIFVTEEESYNEDPQAIRDMILTGITNGGGEPKTKEIPDRFEAIKKALSVARTGDSVVITGMGHEQYRIVQGERIPWNDSAVVREILGVEEAK
ncbi:UDP-N-acetylmuramoyl-L-alanyl-D-glutamate--2,6-diaminopimelate ligase [Candidatus Saccharibacteria bacterium]|nr:UDP-N-acetylmuramoyl-L-alanyl-D-glutamate--2,6-diaminopimelate ligase [Candidatus Saccharibacteria bacterium]NCU40784.1 UDP-N-acetylmuramoyl-L-alanyl-D-glutamate--2,6-diaminopimelate ligase [Candidatus Saccharibacteria bacterium]